MLFTRHSFWALAALFFWSVGTSGQTFQNVTSTFGLTLSADNSEYGCGASLFDINNDGLDDLTLAYNTYPLRIYLNNGNGFTLNQTLPTAADSKSPIWVDYDNDGDNDLFLTRRTGTCKLYRNEGNLVLTDVSANLNIPASPLPETFGAAWGDYDLDGFLDVCIANYGLNGHINWLLHNNGDGTFTSVTGPMTVRAEMSFQPAWIDLNNDLYPDLYIANDRWDGNEFYLNNGNGTFSEFGPQTGLDIELSSMCNSFYDFDRDQDLDTYITNVADGNAFLINEGMYFEDLASAMGVTINQVNWGALWLDYDNNGWNDLFVNSTFPTNNQYHAFFQNNAGELDSMSPTGINRTTPCYANVKGDWNNDGYYDFFSTGAAIFPHYLYQNSGGTNNWIKLDFQGVVSNKNGIGVHYEIWNNGEVQYGQTTCGENYLTQNSQHLIFGFGNSTAVDSVVVTWPSGVIDNYYSLGANTIYHFTEGETQIVSIESSGLDVCPGGNLELSLSLDGTYLWSTGETTSEISISEPGIYTVQYTNPQGLVYLGSIEILSTPLPTIDVSVIHFGCVDENNAEATLVNNSYSSIVWSSGEVGMHAFQLSAGQNTVQIVDQAGCSWSKEFFVEDPSPIISSVATTMPHCYGENTGSVEINSTGGTGIIEPINWDTFSLDPNAMSAGTYEVIVHDEIGCSEVVQFSISQPAPLQLSLLGEVIICNGESTILEVMVSGGNGGYEHFWKDNNVETLMAGEHYLFAQDTLGCTIDSTFIITNHPAIMAYIEATNAGDVEGGAALVTVTGGDGPFEYLWSNGATTPAIDNVFPGDYSCIISDTHDCSVTLSVSVIYVGLDDITESSFSLHAKDHSWVLISDQPHTFQSVALVDLNGKLLFTQNIYTTGNVLNLPTLASGVYILKADEITMKILLN